MDYSSTNRGKIQFRDRSRQIIDFSGLQYGNITPTDIDGLIEYKDKAYAIIEMKHRNAQMAYGQKIAIERMVNDFTVKGKLAAAFLCEHNVDDWKNDVVAKETIVRSCYFNGKWQNDGKRTLKTRLDAFIGYADSFV